MAYTELASASAKQIWTQNALVEYTRKSGYRPYFGRDNESIIITKYELQKQAGKTIHIPLLTRLKGAGVTGSQTLEGNEEQLGNYDCALTLNWRRHAVAVTKAEEFKTEIGLLDAAKPALVTWEAERMRDDVTKAFLSIIPATTTTTPTEMATITEDTTNGGYQITAANWTAGASEADRDASLVLNKDRTVFGALASNYSSGDNSVALATLDSTNDICKKSFISFLKRRAKLANPHIRPYRTEGGKEYFVAFAGPRGFRDLKADMATINSDARPRDVEQNPIFQDGDLIYDGVIVHEVPEIPHIVNVGSGGTTDVEPVFLCGAQALGIAWGQMPTPRTQTRDYGFVDGVAIEELVRVQKLFFNGVQQGLVTGYVAAIADA
jgi:N4-gp56 family major capsid protein